MEKPLCSLWKNYTCNQKPDVHMKLTVTQSGLKAFTKEHGLTEYWSHRITYCLASPQFPRIFCWVYRHEGRKLKQEVRCHAVVCAKESVAKLIAGQLQGRLAQALNEFKRDKISRQNARLSLANSVYDNPSLPRRKILLSTGSHNYRPPLERSKSAPRLMSIEESLEEDDEPADAFAFKRCRAENRLRTGTLRNRMGGLYGYRETAAAAVVATVGEEQRVEIECRRLAESLQLRDDDDDDDVTVAEKERLSVETGDGSEDDDESVATITERPPSPPRPDVMVTSDQQQQQQQQPSLQLNLLPEYGDAIVECPQGPDDACYKYNSLVRDRKRLFESIGDGNPFRRSGSDPAEVTASAAYGNLVKNRKLLFEEGCCRGDEDLDLDSDELLLDEDKDCGYPDDESTPSLQSISSGGSAADAFKKIACTDLDSLSEEEDSDESGYVEAPPARLGPAAATADDDDEDDDNGERRSRNKELMKSSPRVVNRHAIASVGRHRVVGGV